MFKMLYKSTSRLVAQCLLLSVILEIEAVKKSYKNQGLTTFPTNVPDDVTHLDLQLNFLTDVPTGRLLNKHSLEIIDLNDNRFSIFPNLCEIGDIVKNVFLQDNDIDTISTDVLECLNVIAALDLSNNRLSSFPDFSSIGDTLGLLFMRGNPVAMFIDTVDLTSVKHFHMERVNLTDAQLTTLDCPPSVMAYYLQENSLASLPNLGNCHASLSILNLDGNNINIIDKDILQKYRNLSALILSNNPVTTLAGDQTISFRVESLFLDNVDIGNDDLVRQLLASFSNLTTLSYKGGALESWPLPDGVSYPRLTDLNLRTNDIKLIPQHISLLTSIRVIDMTDNRATSSYPDLSKVGGTLEELFLRGTGNLPVYVLAGKFHKLISIMVYRNSGLEIFPKIGYMPVLETLTLTSCRIKSVSFDALNYLPKLKKLALYGNALTTLFDVTTFLPNLEVISLFWNKIVCDCNMLWLTKAHKTTGLRLTYSQYICEQPTHLKDVGFHEIPEEDLQCQGTNLAYKRPAFQIATDPNYPSSTADLAVDGDTNPDFHSTPGTCINARKSQSFPWWVVELCSEEYITTVTAVNIAHRTDFQASIDDFSDASIKVGNSFDPSIFDPVTFTLCHWISSINSNASLIKEFERYPCKTPMNGRFVSISFNHYNPLILCEVAVEGISHSVSKMTDTWFEVKKNTAPVYDSIAIASKIVKTPAICTYECEQMGLRCFGFTLEKNEISNLYKCDFFDRNDFELTEVPNKNFQMKKKMA